MAVCLPRLQDCALNGNTFRYVIPQLGNNKVHLLHFVNRRYMAFAEKNDFYCWQQSDHELPPQISTKGTPAPSFAFLRGMFRHGGPRHVCPKGLLSPEWVSTALIIPMTPSCHTSGCYSRIRGYPGKVLLQKLSIGY